MRTTSLFVAVLAMASPAFAHVGVTPKASEVGATETYTLRVPSEGGMATSSVVLDVPDGVTVLSVTAPEGAKHEERKVEGRIVQVTWIVGIKAGGMAELSFVARNPSAGTSIAWTVHQRYSDGMASHWTGAAGSPSPAPVTKLAPGASR